MKDLRKFIKTTLREFLNENVSNETIFGHDYSDLLDNISNKDAGLTWVEPQEVLDSKIESLRELQNEHKIVLYRLIFAKTKDDINVDKIGNHFVSDVDDFHDDMLDYLYYNAKRENKKIKKSDLWLIKIETQSNNIDFYETILTFSLHPNEDEITIKNDKLIKILSINKF
jgi:hypothetical protein